LLILILRKPDGGIQTVSIQNMSQDRQAVKVKCSDNQLYRVNPVYSFIEPGQTLDVDILRQSGPAKVDKMVFVTAKVRAHFMVNRVNLGTHG